MEQTEVLDLMSGLKLYGMRSAYDEMLATALKRKHDAATESVREALKQLAGRRIAAIPSPRAGPRLCDPQCHIWRPHLAQPPRRGASSPGLFFT
jgi:hypothetical protein